MADATSKMRYSEPDYAKPRNSTEVPYYHTSIEHRIVPETRELLEKYSHIPADQQSKHVHRIRDQAWDVRAYPCTGLGAWLTPQLRRLPIYHDEILKPAIEGATLVDVGTFIGHDLRRLVYDGAPSDNLYGVDIISHWDVGYNFFNDRERFMGHFIEADFLSTTSAALQALEGQVDVLVVSQLLHQWKWEEQVKAAQRLVAFTKPGSLIVGNQIGNTEAQEVTLMGATVWRQNSDSIAKMFETVGAATGTQWETQAWLRTFPEMGWDEKDASWMEANVRLIEFVARRLS